MPYQNKFVSLPQNNEKLTIMNTKTRTDIIPKIQKYLATQPVERDWLFGSFSRGDIKSVEHDKILIYERANYSA